MKYKLISTTKTLDTLSHATFADYEDLLEIATFLFQSAETTPHKIPSLVNPFLTRIGKKLNKMERRAFPKILQSLVINKEATRTVKILHTLANQDRPLFKLALNNYIKLIKTLPNANDTLVRLMGKNLEDNNIPILQDILQSVAKTDNQLLSSILQDFFTAYHQQLTDHPDQYLKPLIDGLSAPWDIETHGDPLQWLNETAEVKAYLADQRKTIDNRNDEPEV